MDLLTPFRRALLLSGALAACAHTRPAPEAAASGAQTSPPPALSHEAELPLEAWELTDLRWVLRGSRVLVAGGWLLDPDTGTFHRLPYSTHESSEGGGYVELGAALSPDGERMAFTDGRTLRLGPVTGPLQPPLDLPLLLSPAKPDGEDPRHWSTLFWRSETQLGLYQLNAETGEGPGCALLEPDTGRWAPLAECPGTSFFHVGAIESGPGGWLAVFSGGEGMSALTLDQSPSAPGSDTQEALSLTLFPAERLTVQFAREEARLYLATPCMLERQEPPPCDDVESRAPWRLYTWAPGGALTLQRQDFPPGAQPDPSGTRWVWAEGMRICVGGVSTAVACFLAPTPLR